jgi:hypothetical protein
MGITRDFQSVQETSLHGSKNANLPYSHAGLHACTLRKAESGAESDSATTGTPLDTVNGHPGAGPVPLSDYDAVFTERAAQGMPANGYRRPRGEGWHLAEAGPGAVVWIKEIVPPALGPVGDDVLDIDPGWGRR